MKTFILFALTFTGIAFCAPSAQAHDWRHRSCHHDSYDSDYSYREHNYYREEYPRCGSYSSSYYAPAPRYYYRPSRSYYSSERCYSERRHSFRPPLISFLFGF